MDLASERRETKRVCMQQENRIPASTNDGTKGNGDAQDLTSLCELPTEVIGLVCRHLPSRSLCHLELVSHELQRAIADSGAWRAQALIICQQSDAPKIVVDMIKFIKHKSISDPRAFKVVLGTNRMVDQTLAELQEVVSSSTFVPDPSDGVFASAAKAKDKIVKICSNEVKIYHEAKIRQIRAWSRHLVRIEEGQDKEEEHYDRFSRMLEVEDGERELAKIEEPRSLGGSPPEGPPCCTMCHIVTAIGVKGKEATLLCASMCYTGTAHSWSSTCGHCPPGAGPYTGE